MSLLFMSVFSGKGLQGSSSPSSLLHEHHLNGGVGNKTPDEGPTHPDLRSLMVSGGL